jgi:hypothetical protein
MGYLRQQLAGSDREQLIAYLADKRWRVETGGIVRNGINLPTDREGRSALKDARDMLRDGELLDSQGNVLTEMAVTIKGASFIVNEAQATSLLQQIAQHVQSAFAVELDLLAGIDAEPPTVSTFADVDAADWPPNT